MYDIILVPTDGSDASEAAVEQGVAVAASHTMQTSAFCMSRCGNGNVGVRCRDIANRMTETLDEKRATYLKRLKTESKKQTSSTGALRSSAAVYNVEQAVKP